MIPAATPRPTYRANGGGLVRRMPHEPAVSSVAGLCGEARRALADEAGERDDHAERGHAERHGDGGVVGVEEVAPGGLPRHDGAHDREPDCTAELERRLYEPGGEPLLAVGDP